MTLVNFVDCVISLVNFRRQQVYPNMVVFVTLLRPQESTKLSNESLLFDELIILIVNFCCRITWR